MWIEVYKLILFVGLFLLLYAYLGYGIFIWLWLKIFRQENKSVLIDSYMPVTLIVAAYNEENFIREKIQNSLSLEYPPGNLKLIFITDGSTDKTPDIIKEYPEIRLLHEAARNGKVAAMHRAMSHVDTPFVIFSDANTILNRESIKNIMRHYTDEKVGGVAGEKKILQNGNGNIAEAGEGLYWKYESFLKKLDSRFYTVVGAAGELFSVRTDLYENPGGDVILDDLIISLNICKKGYRVVYESEAFATEAPSNSLKEEYKRKTRISAGAFQAMSRTTELLNFIKYPKVSFQYVSHRLLRWAICPFLLPLIFVTNLIILFHDASLIYKVLFIGQGLFYTGALLGWCFAKRGMKVAFYPFYYFVFINISLYIGFIKFLRGKQSVLWEKAERKKYHYIN